VSYENCRLLLPLAFVKMGWFILYFSLYNPALMERSAVKFDMLNCLAVW